MKITEGFVAATEDGQFYHMYQVSTHVGYRTEVHIVSSIDDATVSSFPGFIERGHRESLPKTAIWVPVQIRREVVLLGYGVPK